MYTPTTLIFLAMLTAWTQPPAMPKEPDVGAASPAPACGDCHTCDAPTHEDTCLQPCLRMSRTAIAGQLADGTPPDVVILNELEDLYLPVPFDHKGHADMAQMTQGCAVCHHYTPEGATYPACKSCHEVAPERRDIRRPGLKGAYHRQCMSCHREWSHTTACGICHPPKAGLGQSAEALRTPTPDDIVGRLHPPIPEPDTEIYQTAYQATQGTKVIFRHKEHTHRFGLKCVECHREDNCLRCHEEGRKHEQRTKSLDEHHQPCFSCHQGATCDRCHWEQDRPKPGPFDHTSTGWPLERYHGDVGCRDCHSAVPFIARDRNCQVCHQTWAPGVFDHGITGQPLNEAHAEFDCVSCHIDRRFDLPPTCDECHDEDEDIAFPARRPGPEPTDQEPAAPTPK